MARSDVWRWVIIVIAALAIVALLAWARRDAGVDDRVPDPEDASALVVETAVDVRV
jgi:lipopolysaccharide export system protein LptC